MIIFDFDGVLADTLQTCLAACTRAAQRQNCGIEFGADTFADLDPLTFEALAKRHGLNPGLFASDVAEAVSSEPERSPVFEGIDKTLSRLAQFHSLAVVSASHSEVIRSVLRPPRLDGLMSWIIGGDTPGDKAEKIATLIAARPGETHLMVGDAASDVEAARATGIRAVGVSWGWQAPERLLERGASVIARSPDELASTCLNLLDQ